MSQTDRASLLSLGAAAFLVSADARVGPLKVMAMALRPLTGALAAGIIAIRRRSASPVRPCSAPARVLACVVVWLSASVSSAQDADYLRLIDTYRRGDLVGAVAAVAGWNDDQIRGASRRSDVPGSPASAKAAAMLHTEAAFALWPARQSARHLEVARQFVGRLSGDASGGFAARWRVLAATLQVMNGQLPAARLELNRALGHGEDSRHADLMIAALQELAIRRTRESNLRDRWSSGSLEKETRDLVAAYARVVETYPGFLAARLRLGWALFLNRSAAGRDHLEQVAARAAQPDLRYLAHLFLGALAEREQRLDDALRAYEAANAAVSQQSALVGIIAVAGALGDQVRVQRAARAMEALTVQSGDDPWTYYNTGVTGDEVLGSLRAEVRAR